MAAADTMMEQRIQALLGQHPSSGLEQEVHTVAQFLLRTHSHQRQIGMKNKKTFIRTVKKGLGSEKVRDKSILIAWQRLKHEHAEPDGQPEEEEACEKNQNVRMFAGSLHFRNLIEKEADVGPGSGPPRKGSKFDWQTRISGLAEAGSGKLAKRGKIRRKLIREYASFLGAQQHQDCELLVQKAEKVVDKKLLKYGHLFSESL